MKTRPAMDKQARRRRGAFLVEAVFAVVVAVVLMSSLAGALGQLRRAQWRLANERAATRRVETGFLMLQNGKSAEKELVVERLTATAPAGMAWVRVTTPRGELPAKSLEGLVRDGDLPTNAATQGGVR